MELKITKEKVLEASSKCSTSKETLKTLFPEAFEDDKSVSLIITSLNRGDKAENVVIHDIKSRAWVVSLEDTDKIRLSPHYFNYELKDNYLYVKRNDKSIRD